MGPGIEVLDVEVVDYRQFPEDGRLLLQVDFDPEHASPSKKSERLFVLIDDSILAQLVGLPFHNKDKNKIILTVSDLREQGYSIRQIGKILGFKSHNAVFYWIKKIALQRDRDK